MNNFANKQLTRSSSDKMLTGVCGGLARYLDMDASLVRLIVALLVLFTGIGPVVYIAAWLVIPLETGGTLAEDLTGRTTAWVKEQQAKKQPGAAQDPTMNQNLNPGMNPNMPNHDDLR